MTQMIGRLLLAPAKLMQRMVRQDVEQSDNSKITTDANGNAVLNMNNQQVRESMQARMRELAAKR
ncbi:hypothetical protein NMD70_09040 [Edwardsiella tarda]|uniref:hypothetical protein n=1 Tax=Edwardsiella tarda TaxID=636 RepID=UPI00351C7312